MKDQYLIHLLEKVDKVQADISEIKESQARMEVDVAYHIKRTDLLEDMVKELKKVVDLMAAPFYFVRAVLRLLKLVK